MNATEEHSFRQKVAAMTTKELETAIDNGVYADPYLSIARTNLSTRSAKTSKDLDRWRVFLQGLHVFVAYLALIVAVFAFFKS